MSDSHAAHVTAAGVVCAYEMASVSSQVCDSQHWLSRDLKCGTQRVRGLELNAMRVNPSTGK
jgi:hypothetical protein